MVSVLTWPTLIVYSISLNAFMAATPMKAWEWGSEYVAESWSGTEGISRRKANRAKEQPLSFPCRSMDHPLKHENGYQRPLIRHRLVMAFIEGQRKIAYFNQEISQFHTVPSLARPLTLKIFGQREIESSSFIRILFCPNLPPMFFGDLLDDSQTHTIPHNRFGVFRFFKGQENIFITIPL